MASQGEEVSVFTYLYLSAGAPVLGEAKGLIKYFYLKIKVNEHAISKSYLSRFVSSAQIIQNFMK